MAHTPGPWIAQGHTIRLGPLMQLIPARVTGESHDERFERENQEKANAHLIAAAPVLLEALATLRSLQGFEELLGAKYSQALVSDLLAQVDAAIAKARGTS